jgi:hypothetical protein
VENQRLAKQKMKKKKTFSLAKAEMVKSQVMPWPLALPHVLVKFFFFTCCGSLT